MCVCRRKRDKEKEREIGSRGIIISICDMHLVLVGFFSNKLRVLDS